MNFSIRRLSWSSLVLGAFVGCDTAPTPAPAPTPAADPAAPAGEKDKNDIKSMPVDKADATTKTDTAPGVAAVDSEKLSDKEMANIKKLPADEQTIALAQVDCPVSGGHLGGMGMPLRQEVDGKVFFLCCDGCVDKVKEDPKAVLAKLKK